MPRKKNTVQEGDEKYWKQVIDKNSKKCEVAKCNDQTDALFNRINKCYQEFIRNKIQKKWIEYKSQKVLKIRVGKYPNFERRFIRQTTVAKISKKIKGKTVWEIDYENLTNYDKESLETHLKPLEKENIRKKLTYDDINNYEKEFQKNINKKCFQTRINVKELIQKAIKKQKSAKELFHKIKLEKKATFDYGNFKTYLQTLDDEEFKFLKQLRENYKDYGLRNLNELFGEYDLKKTDKNLTRLVKHMKDEGGLKNRMVGKKEVRYENILRAYLEEHQEIKSVGEHQEIKSVGELVKHFEEYYRFGYAEKKRNRNKKENKKFWAQKEEEELLEQEQEKAEEESRRKNQEEVQEKEEYQTIMERKQRSEREQRLERRKRLAQDLEDIED